MAPLRRRTRSAFFLGSLLLAGALAPAGCDCSAGNDPPGGGGSGAGNTGGGVNQGGGFEGCPRCELGMHIDCEGNQTDCDAQELVCDPGLGCVACTPGAEGCIGNEVHECDENGQPNGPLVEVCDVSAGLTCDNGVCKTGCEIAADSPSNVGCEFWVVDLDQQDGFNDPASEPFGVALSNAGDAQANVTIEINNANPGEPLSLTQVYNGSVPANGLVTVSLGSRELDCGTVPNDYDSPGTCLSSKAFRVTSSAPIVVYQFNVFTNQYSNDASLLLPSNALGQTYRIIGWNAGHPVDLNFPGLDVGVDRSYITVVGTQPGTEVTVKPSWKIKGNPPIAATPAGGDITVTLGPFDVLNLETDDGTLQDDPKTVADLSGSAVYSSKPVAVFSGVESTQAPGAWEIPTYPGWSDEDTCCLDHLEDQMFPVEAIGMKYVITRSPIRSTSGFREPDIIRFVGAAETANVQTTLPPPYNSFSIAPGEVVTTWTQSDITVTSDKPVIVGQLLIANQYVDGPYIGDPSLTIFPPVEQYRQEYVILTPGSWSANYVVISAEVGSMVTIDGAAPAGCVVEPAGSIDGVSYESRRCPLSEGAHQLNGDKPFGITAYGYGSAGSYAFAGGADVQKIYEPPPPAE
ncbi:MAG: IgGFc-binding protein [Polyangiaceae bacterium]|nr:IgGFc-binding protein [Polyangiaceae bacterium]